MHRRQQPLGDMRVVGAPETVLGVAQHSQIARLPLSAEQRLEKLRGVALALDGNAQGVALRQLQLGEFTRAAAATFICC